MRVARVEHASEGEVVVQTTFESLGLSLGGKGEPKMRNTEARRVKGWERGPHFAALPFCSACAGDQYANRQPPRKCRKAKQRNGRSAVRTFHISIAFLNASLCFNAGSAFLSSERAVFMYCGCEYWSAGGYGEGGRRKEEGGRTAL